MNQKLELENKKCRKLLEELGIDYEKNEHFADKITNFQEQIQSQNNEIQNLKEEIIRKSEEIKGKNKVLEIFGSLQSENENLKAEIKAQRHNLEKFSFELKNLRELHQNIVEENEKKEKVLVFIIFLKY